MSAFPDPNATRADVAAFFKAQGLDENGHIIWVEFADWNCNDYVDGHDETEDDDEDAELCRGWDGKSPRCDCGNRRVYWSEDEETGDRIAMAD